MTIVNKMSVEVNTALQALLGKQMPAMYHKTRANTAGRFSKR